MEEEEAMERVGSVEERLRRVDNILDFSTGLDASLSRRRVRDRRRFVDMGGWLMRK